MKNILLRLTLVVAIGASLAMGIFAICENRKIKFVDTIKLFNEYELTQTMEGRAQVRINDYERVIDSLRGIYKLIPDKSKADQIVNDINVIQNEYKQFREASEAEINKIVWGRLNPIIDEFGKKKGYSMIVGANGMGTILYAEESKNITSELIIYANSTYAGN